MNTKFLFEIFQSFAGKICLWMLVKGEIIKKEIKKH